MCPSWLPRADFPGATRGSSGLGTTSTFCEPPSPPSASKPVTRCSPSSVWVKVALCPKAPKQFESEPRAVAGCKRRGETRISLPKGFDLCSHPVMSLQRKRLLCVGAQVPSKGRGHSRLFEQIAKVLQCSAGVRAGSPRIRCLPQEVVIIRK